MTIELQKGQRNQSMECCKMIAAFFVVLIHVDAPETFTKIVMPFSLFAVPTFFAISGYFSYGIGHKSLTRRILHLVKLNVIADCVQLIYTMIVTELDGGSTISYLRRAVPDPDELLWLLLTHENRFLAHLWYVAALILCYALLWLYVQFYGEDPVDYRPWYIASMSLFSVYFTLGVVLPTYGFDTGAYRNGWLYGIPMFTLGMFLRQYQERIFRNFRLNRRKLAVTIAAAIFLCVAQRWYMGNVEMPLGLFLEVPALMLFLIACPTVPTRSKLGKALISRFGVLSTGIYILHVTCYGVYNRFLLAPMSQRLGAIEIYLRPFLVYLVALAAGIVWERIDALLNKRKKA